MPPTIRQQVIDIVRVLVASGRTRLIVAVSGIGGLVACTYLAPDHADRFMIGIVLITVTFVIAKTVQDILTDTPGERPGPGKSNETCAQTGQEKAEQKTTT